MRRLHPRRVAARTGSFALTLAAPLLVVAAPVARAQSNAQGNGSASGPTAAQTTDSAVTVAGRVRGPDGFGIANAEVTITPRPAGAPVTLARRIYSDDSGAFRFPALPRGPASLSVRRIGFKPTTLETTIPAESPLAVRLEPTPQTLSAVVVQDRRRVYDGPLGEFNRRRDFGFGRFITRGQIDERNAIRTTDLLRMIPGVQVINGIRGTTLRIRASRCDPLVWVDGTPALAGYFDIDTFTPSSLDGIEIYNGVSEVPVELRGPRGEERCGVVAVWTRMPERRPRQSKRKPVTAEELNALIASATVYTADQVDRPAQADSAAPVEAFFPDSMRATKTSGMAVVEFVVDTEGRVETETISVVQASHPAFARAAREAVFSARFVPALLRGRTVRQLVQLPVEFQASKPTNKR